jgi:hypothetical protein
MSSVNDGSASSSESGSVPLPGEAGPTAHLSELERARLALRLVEDLGELDADARLQWMVSGESPGKAQQAYLLHAATLALVSVAGELEALNESLVAIEADLGALVIHQRRQDDQG